MKKSVKISFGNLLVIIFGFISIIFLFSSFVDIKKPKVAGVTGVEITFTPVPTATNTPIPTSIPATKAPTPIPTKKPVATNTTVTKAPTLSPTNTPAITTIDNSESKVRVIVVRSDNKSLANTQVVIDGKTYTLDNESSVEIPNINLGNHNVKADLGSKEVTKGFVLGEKDLLTGITVVLPIDTSSNITTDYTWLYICIVLILVLILIALILFFIKRKKKKNKPVSKTKRKKKN